MKAKHNYGKVVSWKMDLTDEVQKAAFEKRLEKITRDRIRKAGSAERETGIAIGYRTARISR